MLESLRRSGASIFIYLIFGLLIAIFVINIGPGQGKRGDGGCSGSSNTVITVDGKAASQSAYHVAYSAQSFLYGDHPPTGRNRIYVALETLLRREILANEANARGINVSTDVVQEEVKRGYFFYGGSRKQLGNYIFDEMEDGTRIWSVAKYKNFVQNLNVSPNSFTEEQTRGMEAALMADLLTNSVRVSRDEALGEYLFNNTTVSYDLVTFHPAPYRTGMKLTDADVERFLSTHETEVKNRYKQDERTYKPVSPQLKLRQIFIAKLEPEPKKDEPKKDEPKKDEPKKDDATKKDDAKKDDATKKDDTAKKDAKKDDATKKDDTAKKDAKRDDAKKDDTAKKDDKKAGAAKPVGMTIEAAKAKLEAVRAAVSSGKQKFIDAAKELATDDLQKTNAGALGWHKIENPQLGDKALNDAVKALKPNEMTPVIATETGVFLVMAEDKREGDLSYDQVKTEIAAELARDVWSKEAAKRAAIAAVHEAHKDPKAQKSLDQMFARQATEPQMTPEQQRMFREQLQKQLELQQQQGGGGDNAPGDDDGPHGEIGVHYKDIPAGWFADADGSSNGSGSSASGSGAGSGAPPTPPPAKVAPMVPSKDVLPAFDVPAPKVEKQGPAAHTAGLPGIEGNSKEIADALFDVLAPGAVADRIYEVEGTYYVVQVIEKSQPKVEDFDKQADALIERLRQARAQAFLFDWLGTRCDELKNANRITPSPDLVHETDDQGKPLPTVYHPCSSMPKPGPPAKPPAATLNTKPAPGPSKNGAD